MSNQTLIVDRPDVVATVLPGLLKKDIDLYMLDSPVDPGYDLFVDHNTKPFWDSPDLWVRNQDDGVETHQNPVFGKKNWFYARIRNRGTKPASLFFINFKLTEFLGTEFIYPGDFLTDAHTMVVNLEHSPIDPGKFKVVKMEIDVQKKGHVCWLASVLTEGDWPKFGLNVWDSNNLSQKNLQIVEATAGEAVKINFRAGNVFRETSEMFRLEVLRTRKWAQMPVTIVHPEARKVETVFKTANAPAAFLKQDASLSVDPKGLLHLAYREGLRTGFPVTLPARTPVALELDLTVPKEAKPGDVIDTHLVQRNRENNVVGGFTVRVNVVAKH